MTSTLTPQTTRADSLQPRTGASEPAPAAGADASRATRQTCRRGTRTVLASAVLTIAAVLMTVLGTAPAHATDSGGDGSPTGCANSYTVASRQIVGTRGVTAGKVIGYLELRWSSACYANWSRVVLLGGLYSSPVTVHQEVRAEGRTAMSDDYGIRTGTGGTTAWTRYLRLRNSASTACVTTSVSSDFNTLNFHTVGTSFCV